MKARLIFRQRWSESLTSGKTIAIFMDCYQVDDLDKGFVNAFRLSWIAFNPDEREQRVLMDQHPGRPFHLHVCDIELQVTESPKTVDAAIRLFFTEVENYFGPFLEESE